MDLSKLSISNNHYKFIFGFIVFAGVLLWMINWYAARPLFIDEANVARNLYDRNFGQLFSPLDHDQYAPPFYLVLAKICGEVFGYGERALRIPSILGGLLTLIGLFIAGEKLELGKWGILPIALLFVNPTVLRFVGELKPYALDMGIAAMLIALAVYRSKPSWHWALLGVTLIWFSLPVVFVLAAISITSIWYGSWQDFKRWIFIILSWLGSFFLLYSILLKPSIGSSYLNDFHSTFFFPLPTTQGFNIKQAATLLLGQPRLAFGFTVAAIAWGSVISVFALAKAPRKVSLLLLLPVLIVFLVSATKNYSLIPRLMLFTLPGWWLLAAVGTAMLYRNLAKTILLKFGIVLLWSIVLLGTNVVKSYYSPLVFSDGKRLATEIDPGYIHIVHSSAAPTYDYYTRIHPETRTTNQNRVKSNNLQDQVESESYVALYDVLTQNSIVERVTQDSTWASTQGATEIRVVSMFRAKALYVKLPHKE
jgi:hypothetical protein